MLTLSGTINGGFALTIDSTGPLRIDGAIGGTTPLTSISLSGSGTSSIYGGEITTTGTQTYAGLVYLYANTTFTTTNSDITFSNSLEDGYSHSRTLTISTGNGNTTFQSHLGSGYVFTDINITTNQLTVAGSLGGNGTLTITNAGAS